MSHGCEIPPGYGFPCKNPGKDEIQNGGVEEKHAGRDAEHGNTGDPPVEKHGSGQDRRPVDHLFSSNVQDGCPAHIVRIDAHAGCDQDQFGALFQRVSDPLSDL